MWGRKAKHQAGHSSHLLADERQVLAIVRIVDFVNVNAVDLIETQSKNQSGPRPTRELDVAFVPNPLSPHALTPTPTPTPQTVMVPASGL